MIDGLLYPNIKIDKAAFVMAERIRADCLKMHPMPDDAMERIRLSELAQKIADECVLYDLISQ